MSTGRNRGGWLLTEPGRGRRTCSLHKPSDRREACPLHKPPDHRGGWSLTKLVSNRRGWSLTKLRYPGSSTMPPRHRGSFRAGRSTIRPLGPWRTSAARTPSPSTSPTATSRPSRRRRRECGTTRVRGGLRRRGARSRITRIGIRRLIRRSDGGRRYEVHHRRARFQAGETRRGLSAKNIESLVTIDEVGTEASPLGATATAGLIAASGAPRLTETPLAVSTAGRGASSEAPASCGGWRCARSST